MHLSLPDRAGHAHGFMGKQYLDAVQRTDRLLGRMLEHCGQPIPPYAATPSSSSPRTTGEEARSHYAASKLQNYRIPFMAWGPGVAAGRNLYGLNPSFRSPGASRTSYRGKQPIRNADLANLVDRCPRPAPGSRLGVRQPAHP